LFSGLRAEGRFLDAGAVEDVQDVDGRASLAVVDAILAGGKATDFCGNVAGRLAGEGMLAEEFEPCSDALNDTALDVRTAKYD